MRSLTTILLFLTIGAVAQVGERVAAYRGIVPLQSTRADVERVLGRSREPDGTTYYFPDQIVSIQYSKYGCAQPPTVEGWPVPPIEGWNVAPNTVLVVRVRLRNEVPIESLELDLKTFVKKRGDSDVASHYYYVDDNQGLVLDLNGEGDREIVSDLIYRPAAKYKHLRCSEKNSDKPVPTTIDKPDKTSD